jgi:hypothetical protein
MSTAEKLECPRMSSMECVQICMSSVTLLLLLFVVFVIGYFGYIMFKYQNFLLDIFQF